MWTEGGLESPWIDRVWLNPPYGRETGLWLRTLAAHGSGIALVFARTETEMFHQHAGDRAPKRDKCPHPLFRGISYTPEVALSLNERPPDPQVYWYSREILVPLLNPKPCILCTLTPPHEDSHWVALPLVPCKALSQKGRRRKM